MTHYTSSYSHDDLKRDVDLAIEELGETPTDEERHFVLTRVRFGVRATAEKHRAEMITPEVIRSTVEALLASRRRA